MCKLCNESTSPIVPIRELNLSKPYGKFLEIAHSYTEEYPCQNCIDGFYKRNRTNLDTYIIQKLLLKYGNTRKSFESINIKHTLKKYKKVINPHYPVNSKKSIRIETNIFKVIILRTDTEYFTYKRDKKSLLCFKTLKEAQNYKEGKTNDYKKCKS